MTEQPGQVRPAGAVRRPARRGDRDGQGAHPDVRQRRQGVVTRPHLRLRRRARRHRARRPPASPSTRRSREFGLPLEWSEEEYGREAADRRRQGADGQRADARVRPRPTGCPTTPRARPPSWPTGTGARPRSTPRWSPPGRLPTRPGIRRIIAEAQDAGWDAGRGLDLGGAVGAGHPRAGRRAGARGPVRRRPRRRRRRRSKKPAPDIYLLALRAARRPAAETLVIEDSRNGLLAAVGAGLRCVMTVNGYTEEEDNSEAILVVSSLGDPGGERTRVIANRSAASPATTSPWPIWSAASRLT